MKVSCFSFASLACISAVHAQYFSAGWSPGQQASSAAATPQTPEAARTAPTPASGFLENLLASGPIANVFASLGINITERLEAAAKEQAEMWDNRIPLITDENYGDVVVNEKLTPEEEKERLWFLVISMRSDQQPNAISKLVDQAFDAAYNESIIAGDLPHVRWGRIDYMNVTYITTKWAIWQAPYIVVVKDRGQSLRFYRASQLRVKVDLIRQFLKNEQWKATPTWATMYSPGGSREWVMEYLAIGLKAIYTQVVLVPRWLLVLITGGLASLVMGYLHAPAAKPAIPPKSSPPKRAVEVAAEKPPTPPHVSDPKRTGTKQRKGSKK